MGDSATLASAQVDPLAARFDAFGAFLGQGALEFRGVGSMLAGLITHLFSFLILGMVPVVSMVRFSRELRRYSEKVGHSVYPSGPGV